MRLTKLFNNLHRVGWKSYSDELDARPQPIVAIPIRRSWMILGFIIGLAVRWAVPVILVLCIILVLCMAARQWPRPDKMQGEWDLGSVDAAVWIKVFLPWAVAAVIVLAAMFWPWPPEFAVFKDGIKLPDGRHSPKRSIWDLWSYGFYFWSEVSYCRWSRYQKGVLAVHLKPAEHCVDVVLWGTGPPPTAPNSPPRNWPCVDVVLWGTGPPATKRPAMIFNYRVPERSRAEVEAAIRACGKWAV